MCPIYEYLNEKTGEVIEEIRPIKDRDNPYITSDGIECKRIMSSSFNGWKVNKEVFEADRDLVKRTNPKYVKFQDGHRERYDPNKHC